MKKHTRLVALACCVLLAALLTVPALAHGGRHGARQERANPYPVCTVADCQQARAHTHDGETYCGHTRNDGHAQHAACAVSGCTRLGEHTHGTGGCGGGRCHR